MAYGHSGHWSVHDGVPRKQAFQHFTPCSRSWSPRRLRKRGCAFRRWHPKVRPPKRRAHVKASCPIYRAAAWRTAAAGLALAGRRPGDRRGRGGIVFVVITRLGRGVDQRNGADVRDISVCHASGDLRQAQNSVARVHNSPFPPAVDA